MPSNSTEQRKLAAIMFTDMVGYSALAQRNETLALQLLEEHRGLLRVLFPRFNGREVKTIGDAFLVEFHSALEAAQCGIEIQCTLAKRNHDVPVERRLELKIGIHIGDVVKRADGDVLGDGVNIASRIESLAGANGICISVDVERQIRNTIEASLVKLGPTELKNIQMPMELFRIVLPWEKQSEGSNRSDKSQTAKAEIERSRLTSAATRFGWVAALLLLPVGIGWWFVHQSGQATKPLAGSLTSSATPEAPGATPTPDQKSIAVLAFVNLSADKENEYFSDGITEEILNALARTPGLRVVARTSAFSFKGKNESVLRIGETLNVGAVLEGSVRRVGNQLRIDARLVNVTNESLLWSDRFDRKAEDVFAIQTEVTQRVQEALKLKLLAGSSSNATVAGTDNLEAYDLYLRGRHLWNQRTGADMERAVGFFQQATEKDPKFAAAYSGLAAGYSLLPDYAAVPVRETNPKARAAARRALELDGRLAEPHAVLGACAQADWDLVRAEQEFQEARRLNPNHATSHHSDAEMLGDQGKIAQSLAEIHKAQLVDPLSAIIQVSIGEKLIFAGRYDEALGEVDKALRLSPEFLPAYNVRGRILLLQRRIPEAVGEFEKIRKKTSDAPYALGSLGYAYAREGRTNEARQILEKLKSNSASGSSVSGAIAFVNQGLRDLDQAFVWLERAVESRERDPRALRVDPLAADMVNDPRYAALLKNFRLDK